LVEKASLTGGTKEVKEVEEVTELRELEACAWEFGVEKDPEEHCEEGWGVDGRLRMGRGAPVMSIPPE